MKRIIRLTESDLITIVKRVINEQNEDPYKSLAAQQVRDALKYNPNLGDSVGKKAFTKIKKGMETTTLGINDTDEDSIAKAIYSLKTKKDYDDCIKEFKKIMPKFTTLCDYLETKMPLVVTKHAAPPLEDLGMGLNNYWMSDWSKYLKKFNEDEGYQYNRLGPNKPFWGPNGWN